MTVADVVDSERNLIRTAQRFQKNPDNSFDNVVDVGEVPLHVAVVVQRNRGSVQDRAGEFEQGHVRASPRTVDREKTQAGRRNSEERGVGTGHQFTALFRRGVKTYRVRLRVVLAEGDVRRTAVDARTRGEDEMLHRVVTASFQDVEESVDVALDVDGRIFHTVAHAGLSGQMTDRVEFFLVEELDHRGGVLQIQLAEASAERRLDHAAVGDVFGLETAFLQAGELQIDVVIIVQIVDSEDVVSHGSQAAVKMKADESGGACNQYFFHDPRSVSCPKSCLN